MHIFIEKKAGKFMKRNQRKKAMLIVALIIILFTILIRGFTVNYGFDMANPLFSAKNMAKKLYIISINQICMPVTKYVSEENKNIFESFLYTNIPLYTYINSEYPKSQNEMQGIKDKQTKIATASSIEIITQGEVEEIKGFNQEEMAAFENENARVSSVEDMEMSGENEGKEESIQVGENTLNQNNTDSDNEQNDDADQNINQNSEQNNNQSQSSTQSDNEKDNAKAGEESQETMAKQAEGIVYTNEQLEDFEFLKGSLYTVDSSTSITEDRLNAKALLNKDFSMEKDNNVPQILIYHTHSQEAFKDYEQGNTDATIVGVGRHLAQLLANKYGYNVIHNTSSYDMIDGKLDRNYAFTLAEADVKKILSENPSIQVIIDLHRDGVNENTHFVTNINGKDTAKIMFFNGLSYNNKVGNIDYLYNPYIEDNLAFSLQMQLKALEKYPDYMRRIYLKGYRYNLHLMKRATLVEVGGQTNTFEEAKNAMEPLAEILNEILTEK